MKTTHSLLKLLCSLTAMVLLATAATGADPFTRITNGPVAMNVGAAIAAAWGDYDNDGFIDLFFGAGFGQQDFLYHNNGDGTFAQVTMGEIVTLPSDTSSAVWGDYDNDGHLDLFLSNVVSPAADRLFHSNGDGSFTRVTTGSIVNDSALGLCAAWADYDRDGWIDLFVANGGPANFLYRNLSDGTFLQITDGTLVNTSGNWQTAAWADFDNDGNPDLAVGHYFSSDTRYVYRNDGNGVFTPLPALDAEAAGSSTQGLAWGDYDNDGDLDLIVARTEGQNDQLFENLGDGTFRLVTESSVSNDGKSTTSPSWGDYDNDGWLDLFVSGDFGDGNLLYHNNGDGTFTLVREGSITTDGGGEIGSYGAAWGDYDNDGYLDLFVANSHPNPNVFENRRPFLYHNNGGTNHWIMFHLVGNVSNRSAIGAKVRLKATIGGKTFWQLREISGGSGGFTCQHDQRAHFGLGDATHIEALRIEWPSGIVQELSAPELNRIHTVTEPPKVEATGLGSLRVYGRNSSNYIVEASADLSRWQPIGTVSVGEEFADTEAGSFSRRFYRAQEAP